MSDYRHTLIMLTLGLFFPGNAYHTVHIVNHTILKGPYDDMR